jgi:hypothetical protein
LVFSLVGCNEREIVSGLDQREKVTVLSALLEGGIDAREEVVTSGKQSLYTLYVSSSYHPLAIQILSRLGLPRREGLQQRELLGGDSLIPPTPEVIALRLELMAGERLRSLLQTLPNVVDAEVLYRNSSSSAQATILIRHSGDGEEIEETVEKVALQTFPELVPEQLDLKLYAVSRVGELGPLAHIPKPFSFRVPRSERGLATTEVFSWLGGSILMALFVGFYAGLHVSTLFWKRLEKRRAERRRTGEYAVVPVKTAASIPVVRQDSDGPA